MSEYSYGPLEHELAGGTFAEQAHINQIENYPKNTRIEAITEILCHVGSIPAGTRGTVTGHCDDGRAWVFFDGYDAGHTFHEPEECIRVIEQPRPTETRDTEAGEDDERFYHVFRTCPTLRNNHTEHEPAPRAAERAKLTVRDFDYHQYGDITLNETHNDITVAVAYMQGRGPEIKQRAQEIADANNQHSTLIEQRDRLLEALKQFVSPTQCYCHTLLYGSGSRKCGQCEARELITTIEQGVKNAGKETQ